MANISELIVKNKSPAAGIITFIFQLYEMIFFTKVELWTIISILGIAVSGFIDSV